MKLLDLGKRNAESTADTIGVEVPGTISIYLVRFRTGAYFKERIGGEFPDVVDSWAEATFYFGAVGMLAAKSMAERYDAEVYIVSCTPPAKYRD